MNFKGSGRVAKFSLVIKIFFGSKLEALEIYVGQKQGRDSGFWLTVLHFICTSRNRTSEVVNIKITRIMELTRKMINGSQMSAYCLVEISQPAAVEIRRLFSCNSTRIRALFL